MAGGDCGAAGGASEPTTNALVILGKGNKQRTVYVAPGMDAALADWLALRNRAIGSTRGIYLRGC